MSTLIKRVAQGMIVKVVDGDIVGEVISKDDNGEITLQLAAGTMTALREDLVKATKAEKDALKAEVAALQEAAEESQEGDEGDEPKHSMAKLKMYRAAYKRGVHTNDDLATLLDGRDLLDVQQIAILVLGTTLAEAKFEKYENLNAGQQRMNLGNMIRNRIKKGEFTVEAIADHMGWVIEDDAEDDAEAA